MIRQTVRFYPQLICSDLPTTEEDPRMHPNRRHNLTLGEARPPQEPRPWVLLLFESSVSIATPLSYATAEDFVDRVTLLPKDTSGNGIAVDISCDNET
jgi:hypothetical protein